MADALQAAQAVRIQRYNSVFKKAKYFMFPFFSSFLSFSFEFLCNMILLFQEAADRAKKCRSVSGRACGTLIRIVNLSDSMLQLQPDK